LVDDSVVGKRGRWCFLVVLSEPLLDSGNGRPNAIQLLPELNL
jgi:hypothetical protein